MTEVLVFHHAQGLTEGVHAFADRLRDAGHAVTVPDLYDGATAGVALQIHSMDRDPIFVDEGDLDAARELVASVAGAELFLYPGDQHLFTDRSLPAYDESATALLEERVLEFLDRHGSGYDGWPLVMLRLEMVDLERLTELITDAWRMRADLAKAEQGQ
jgi:dienelactone hydrolase